MESNYILRYLQNYTAAEKDVLRRASLTDYGPVKAKTIRVFLKFNHSFRTIEYVKTLEGSTDDNPRNR